MKDFGIWIVGMHAERPFGLHQFSCVFALEGGGRILAKAPLSITMHLRALETPGGRVDLFTILPVLSNAVFVPDGLLVH